MDEQESTRQAKQVLEGMSGWLLLVEYAMNKEQFLLDRQSRGELRDTENVQRPISLKVAGRRESEK
jgi:hypothetical protein